LLSALVDEPPVAHISESTFRKGERTIVQFPQTQNNSDYVLFFDWIVLDLFGLPRILPHSIRSALAQWACCNNQGETNFDA